MGLMTLADASKRIPNAYGHRPTQAVIDATQIIWFGEVERAVPSVADTRPLNPQKANISRAAETTIRLCICGIDGQIDQFAQAMPAEVRFWTLAEGHVYLPLDSGHSHLTSELAR